MNRTAEIRLAILRDLITGISNKITGEMRWRITDAGQAELSNQ